MVKGAVVVLGACVLLLWAGTTTPAAAKGKKKAPPTSEGMDAEEWFDKAATHHKLGELELAAAAYKEAYRLGRHPVQLLNLATVYKDLGHDGEAIRYYKLYLLEDPDTPLRGDVEKRIAAAEARVAGAGTEETADAPAPDSGPGGATSASEATSSIDPATATVPTAEPTPTTPPPPKKKKSGLAIGIGVGGAVIVAGVAATVVALVATADARYIAGFSGETVNLEAGR